MVLDDYLVSQARQVQSLDWSLFRPHDGLSEFLLEFCTAIPVMQSTSIRAEVSLHCNSHS